MGRPPKAVSVIEEEGRSHRTKAEKEARRNAENALRTKKRLTERAEVKENETAHKEFKRIKALFEAVSKDDALYAGSINRYCLLYSEIKDMRKLYASLVSLIESIEDIVDNLEDAETDDVLRISKELNNLTAKLISVDGGIMKKRKMMGDIEKENSMTVASALRTIPKEPDPSGGNPLIAALLNDDD